MTNEEKRFKIEKIEKYKKEIKKSQTDIAFDSFLVGGMALLTILLVSSGVVYDEIILGLSGFISGGSGTLALVQLMKAIAKKTHLNLDLDKLRDELQMGENQEIKRR